MSIASKNWLIAPVAPANILRGFGKIPPILAQVLYNRGFRDSVAAEKFLYARDVDVNPFRMKGMSEAVTRIRQAIDQRESIVIYGDFDADGVTSSTLLFQVLNRLRADVRVYIPDRVDEGYGLNVPALEKLAAEGVQLVITVDCGIRSVEEVAAGIACGLDIIITDHHSVGPEVPQTLAVINPKQVDCRYPEDMLAGVGVAFRLAQALLNYYKSQNDPRVRDFPQEALLDLVAIGTVADMVPLDSLENRALVRRGLERIRMARRPGIRALLEVADTEPEKVTAMSIGFGLAPRINAAGRLASAMTAFQLLSATSAEVARPLAEQLDHLNDMRQRETRDAQELVRGQLEVESVQEMSLIFAADSGFKPGIVGLVAGRLVEEFYRPAVVMELGEMESRASCRSIPQFNITEALDRCADLLLRHGGHGQAAGFSVYNDNIEALKARLTVLAEQTLVGQDLRPTLEIDAILRPQSLNENLLEDLQLLEPTGTGNAVPVFMLSSVAVTDARQLGSDGQHLRFKVMRQGLKPLDAIAFGMGAWAELFEQHAYVDVAFQLELNEWNGRRSLQLNVQDIRPAEGGHNGAH